MKLKPVNCVFIVLCAVILVTMLGLYCSRNSGSLKCVTMEEERPSSDTRSSISQEPIDNPFKDNKDWTTFVRALEKYRVFHRRKLQQMKESSDGDVNVRTLTWACSKERCSGIGDQLLRIQYFFLLAMMSDRMFTIRWDKKLKKAVAHLVPNNIQWDYFDESKGMCEDTGPSSGKIYDTTTIFNFAWTKKEFSDFGEELFSSTRHITVTGRVYVDGMFIANYSVLDPGEKIRAGMQKLGVQQIFSEAGINDTLFARRFSHWYDLFHMLGINYIKEIPSMDGGFVQASDSWMNVSHTILTYLFAFSEDMLTTAVSYQKSLNLYGKDYVVLHLRTGFFGTSHQEKFLTRLIAGGWKLFANKQHWKCLIEHSIDLRDRTLGPTAPIYISTDTHLVKEEVIKSYADKNIVLGSFKPTHTANKHNTCSRTDDSLGLWLDFLVMGRAKKIVHPISSFSINAAFLSPILLENRSVVMYDSNRKCLAVFSAGREPDCICDE